MGMSASQNDRMSEKLRVFVALGLPLLGAIAVVSDGFSAFGAWMSYGLGAETDDLPSYIVIPDARGLPAGGSINWSNGFLPARHQGVIMRSQGTAVDDLVPARQIPQPQEIASRELLNASIGMVTRTCSGSTDARLCESTSRWLHCFVICAAAVCWMTRWCCLPPNSVALRLPNQQRTRLAPAETITRKASPSGWPAPRCPAADRTG